MSIESIVARVAVWDNRNKTKKYTFCCDPAIARDVKAALAEKYEVKYRYAGECLCKILAQFTVRRR
jgi:hypothetical protein